MRILLVKPPWTDAAGREQVRYAKHVKFPALALGYLAALSNGHDVRVCDAGWESIPWDDPFDLVGITATTFASRAAYDIAAHFRRRKIPVVMGGVHPTILPDECLQHADAVVVGEAEYVWKDVLRDAAQKRLRPRYQAAGPTDLRHVPFPRRDLLGEAPWFTAVEATRGCPNTCHYCYLPATPWAAPRQRPVELVTEEIRLLPQKTFIFVDENLFADRDYALRLLRAIAPFNKFWLAQAPTDIADDIELLDAMSEAGCFNVQVGFQSFNSAVLTEAGVHHNRIERYRRFIERLHDRRIVVSGFFMFGFDADRPDVFPATVRMIEDLGLDDASLFLVTPFPGTEFHARFQREGRLLPHRSRRQFGWANAVFQPRHMSPDALEANLQQAYDQLHPIFRRRLPRVLLTQADRLAANPRFAWALLKGNFRYAQASSTPNILSAK